MKKIVFEITDLKTGKTRRVPISEYMSELGKKSVKARHKGKSKKELSEYYKKIRVSKVNPILSGTNS